ncbi:MAG: sensor domain-containing diguanylate cyclase [Pedobacter sp.]|nr:sensor domain-containing diguanylate cyclase [Pedobacter sp.]
MAAAPLPADELARLATLRKYDVLDTPPEQAFDDAVKLASVICGTPIALVTLIDESRQWFKAKIGLDGTETERDHAFCAHAILEPQHVMVVPDATQDPRFVDNPYVTGDPEVRFYAGAPLVSPSGHAMGTLCVIDSAPRAMADDKRDALAAIARTVSAQLELRRVSHELSVANDHLRTLSFIDPLTGVANRRALDARLNEEIARAARHDAPLSLLMFDIDHFKSYNDEFGHVLGDDVLLCFAELLRMDIRQTDLVARFGGEEFVVLLPETTEEGARMLAERYRARVESTNFPGKKITTSIGLAVWQPRFEQPEQFIDAADQALYAAKRAGRNRVEVAQEFHPGH